MKNRVVKTAGLLSLVISGFFIWGYTVTNKIEEIDFQSPVFTHENSTKAADTKLSFEGFINENSTSGNLEYLASDSYNKESKTYHVMSNGISDNDSWVNATGTNDAKYAEADIDGDGTMEGNSQVVTFRDSIISGEEEFLASGATKTYDYSYFIVDENGTNVVYMNIPKGTTYAITNSVVLSGEEIQKFTWEDISGNTDEQIVDVALNEDGHNTFIETHGSNGYELYALEMGESVTSSDLVADDPVKDKEDKIKIWSSYDTVNNTPQILFDANKGYSAAGDGVSQNLWYIGDLRNKSSDSGSSKKYIEKPALLNIFTKDGTTNFIGDNIVIAPKSDETFVNPNDYNGNNYKTIVSSEIQDVAFNDETILLLTDEGVMYQLGLLDEFIGTPNSVNYKWEIGKTSAFMKIDDSTITGINNTNIKGIDSTKDGYLIERFGSLYDSDIYKQVDQSADPTKFEDISPKGYSYYENGLSYVDSSNFVWYDQENNALKDQAGNNVKASYAPIYVDTSSLEKWQLTSDGFTLTFNYDYVTSDFVNTPDTLSFILRDSDGNEDFSEVTKPLTNTVTIKTKLDPYDNLKIVGYDDGHREWNNKGYDTNSPYLRVGISTTKPDKSPNKVTAQFMNDKYLTESSIAVKIFYEDDLDKYLEVNPRTDFQFNYTVTDTAGTEDVETSVNDTSKVSYISEGTDSGNKWVEYQINNLPSNAKITNFTISDYTRQQAGKSAWFDAYTVPGTTTTEKMAPEYVKGSYSDFEAKERSVSFNISINDKDKYESWNTKSLVVGYGGKKDEEPTATTSNFTIQAVNEADEEYTVYQVTIKGLTPNFTYENLTISIDNGQKDTWHTLSDVTTLGLDPEYKGGGTVKDIQQKSAIVEIPVYAGGITSTTSGTTTLIPNSTYDPLDTDNVIVQVESSSDKAGTPLDVWTTVNNLEYDTTTYASTSRVKIIATLNETNLGSNLDLNTNYSVQFSIDGGENFIYVTGFTTLTKEQNTFKLKESDENDAKWNSYKFDLILDQKPGIEYEDFKPDRIRIVYGDDETQLAYEEKDKVGSANTYEYTVTGLNPDLKPEGETYENVRVYYADYDISSAFNAGDITTEPLKGIEKPIAGYNATALASTQDSITFNMDLTSNSIDESYQEVIPNGANQNITFYKTVTSKKGLKIDPVEIDGNDVSVFNSSVAGTTTFTLSRLERGSTFELYADLNNSGTQDKIDFAAGNPSTSEQKTPDLKNVSVTNVSQTTAKFSADITSGGAYAEFDPNTGIEFRLYTDDNTIVYPGFVLTKESGVSTPDKGTIEETKNYSWNFDSLPPETKFVSVEYSINNSAWLDADAPSFQTQDKYPPSIIQSSYSLISQTYNSITFALEVNDAGIYESFDKEGVTGSVSSFGQWYTADSVEVSLPSSKGTSTRSTTVTYATEYEFTLKGLPSNKKFTKIKLALTEGGAEQTIGSGYTTIAQTDPQKESTIKSFVIDTLKPEPTTFDFTVKILSGGEYEDFDTTGLSLYADESEASRDKAIFVTPTRVKVDISFQELQVGPPDSNAIEKEYKYKAFNLSQEAEYSNFYLSLDNRDIDEGSANGFSASKGVTYTTSLGDNPIIASTFRIVSNSVTEDQFEFKININEDTSQFAVFDPSKLVLYYTDDKGQIVALNTTNVKLANSGGEGTDSINSVEYSFEVTDLDAGNTYSNFLVDVDGNGEIPAVYVDSDITVTTNALKSPFDPDTNLVDFDYDSITKNSFEFTIAIKSVTSKAEYSSFSKNETIFAANYRRFKTTCVGEDDTHIADDELIYYTYRVEGLEASTVYTDVSITINAYNGAKYTEDTKSNSVGKVFYQYTYKFSYVTIKTDIDPHAYIVGGTISLILLAIILLFIIGMILFKKVERSLALTIFGMKESTETGILTYQISNVRRHKEIWDKPSDELTLYGATNKIDAQFIRDHSIGGYKVLFTSMRKNNMNIIWYAAAIKYGDWEISTDGGKTRHKILQISDKKVNKFIKKQHKIAHKEYKKSKSGIKGNSKGKGSLNKFDYNGKQIIVAWSKDETTQTSVRYLQVFPPGHPLLEKADTLAKTFSFFHNVDGQLYELKTSLAGIDGTVVSWDITGLQPGTAYVNIYFSLDGGKVKLNSFIPYFITHDEADNEVKLKKAKLAKGGPKSKAHNLPVAESVIDYVGDEIWRRSLTVAIKKHVQRDSDVWISSKQAKEQEQIFIDKWYSKTDELNFDVDEINNRVSFIREGKDTEETEVSAKKKVANKGSKK